MKAINLIIISLVSTIYGFTQTYDALSVEEQYNWGCKYLEERDDVIQNYKEAFFWFTEAAKRGYAPAQNNLGVMYRKGHGVTLDNKEALFWFHKAAENGNPRAIEALKSQNKDH